jgi:hypothetical protein
LPAGGSSGGRRRNRDKGFASFPDATLEDAIMHQPLSLLNSTSFSTVQPVLKQHERQVLEHWINRVVDFREFIVEVQDGDLINLTERQARELKKLDALLASFQFRLDWWALDLDAEWLKPLD